MTNTQKIDQKRRDALSALGKCCALFQTVDQESFSMDNMRQLARYPRHFFGIMMKQYRRKLRSDPVQLQNFDKILTSIDLEALPEGLCSNEEESIIYAACIGVSVDRQAK